MNSLHYLVTQNQDYVVAHCLDCDLVSTGGTIEEAIKRLDVLMRCHALTMSNTTKAPPAFWQRFDKADHYDERPLDLKNPTIQILEWGQSANINILTKIAA